MKTKAKLIPGILLLLIAFTSCQQHEKDVAAHWSFEGADDAIAEERISKHVFTIHSDVHAIETARGVKGRALRLDGYSTWAMGKIALKKELKSFSVSTWFALKSFPVDQASIISAYDSATKTGFKLSVNEYGYPLAVVEKQGKREILKGKEPIAAYKWQHLVVSISSENLQLYNNGVLLAKTSHSLDGYNFPSMGDIYLGKGYEEKKVARVFPVNTINGIIDEVKIYEESLTNEMISSVFEDNKPAQKPELNIPKSRFADDFHRPEYHPIPPAAWTNETHGLLYKNDNYHIFYQKNAAGPFWAHINWGHMSSPDLLEWNHHKPVLWPEKGYDQKGIWSGHIVKNDDGKPVIMYTSSSGEEFGMALAYPDNDSLTEWTKYSDNPVVKRAPEKFQRTDMRDPYIWKENDTYYMIIGFGVMHPEEAGAVLHYKSKNLKEWKYLDLMHVGKPEIFPSGVFWEMPVFWKFEDQDKYVLLVNKIPYKGDPARAFYWVGNFEDERFIPDHNIPKLLEVVNGLLSPSVSRDKENRTTAIAIIPDEIGPKANYQLGWAHLYSMPRVWKLEDGYIKQYPHPNLQRLRADHHAYKNITISAGSDEKPDIAGRQLELIAEISRGSSRKAGIMIGKDPKGEEFTKISYDFGRGEFIVDRRQSSLNKLMHNDIKKGILPDPITDKLRLHVFIDGSVVEVFVNDGHAFTTRMFPEKDESNHVEFFSEGGQAQIQSLDVWKMNIQQIK